MAWRLPKQPHEAFSLRCEAVTGLASGFSSSLNGVVEAAPTPFECAQQTPVCSCGVFGHSRATRVQRRRCRHRQKLRVYERFELPQMPSKTLRNGTSDAWSISHTVGFKKAWRRAVDRRACKRPKALPITRGENRICRTEQRNAAAAPQRWHDTLSPC